MGHSVQNSSDWSRIPVSRSPIGVNAERHTARPAVAQGGTTFRRSESISWFGPRRIAVYPDRADDGQVRGARVIVVSQVV